MTVWLSSSEVRRFPYVNSAIAPSAMPTAPTQNQLSSFMQPLPPVRSTWCFQALVGEGMQAEHVGRGGLRCRFRMLLSRPDPRASR